MIDFKFKFDTNKFRKNVMSIARHSIEDRVKRIRCPEHLQTARVHFTGYGDRLRWRIEGCCKQLIEEVNKTLG